MTPRDPEIVIAEIIAAFERTKFRPCWGTWFTKDGEACGIGAVALDQQELQPHDIPNIGLGGHETCVADGWDAALGDCDPTLDEDERPVCEGCGRTECDYYAAGATAAIAMETQA